MRQVGRKMRSLCLPQRRKWKNKKTIRPVRKKCRNKMNSDESFLNSALSTIDSIWTESRIKFKSDESSVFLDSTAMAVAETIRATEYMRTSKFQLQKPSKTNLLSLNINNGTTTFLMCATWILKYNHNYREARWNVNGKLLYIQTSYLVRLPVFHSDEVLYVIQYEI
jgi:hypothetical protein